MFGAPGANEAEQHKQMADFQVKSSLVQFAIAVGLINLAPYVIEALMGENPR